MCKSVRQSVLTRHYKMIADFNKKENRIFSGKKLLFKAVGIIFLAAIFLLIVADIKMYQKKQALISQIDNYQKQIEDIKKSSQNLRDEIANSDNVDYLEKLAYEQLGEQKPGEKQIIFVMPEGQPEQETESQNFLDSFSGWLSGAWQWIKNKF